MSEVAAPAGYFCLVPHEDGTFVKSPIVAWRIIKDYAEPITLEIADDRLRDYFGVMLPDGKVWNCQLTVPVSKDEYSAFVKREIKELEQLKEMRRLSQLERERAAESAPTS